MWILGIIINPVRYKRGLLSFVSVLQFNTFPHTFLSHWNHSLSHSKSFKMRVLSLVPVVVGLLATAEAHTRVYGVWINGVRDDARHLYCRALC